MIAAVYARKSTDQNVADEAKSVRRQIEHAHQYAKRKGWTVSETHVYVDDGVSGAEFANRPGFLRLMNAVKPRAPFQVLVMSEESRLGREAIETAYALKQLVTAGVQVWFYLDDRQRTIDSPTDKIMLSLATFADEVERERARQRAYDTALRKAKAGHVTGGRVFGYQNVELLDAGGSHSHVERQIVEAEAAVIRQIFSLSTEGYGMKAIAKRLNLERAPSPRAQQGRSQTWAPSSVREVLFRDLYRGVITWNRSRKRNAWGQHEQRARPAGDWIEVPAPHLAIVSSEAWANAHARLETVRAIYMKGTNGRLFGRPPLGDPSRYLLTSLALCGCCGCPLKVLSRDHGRTRGHFYGCAGYHDRGRTVCTNKSYVPMADADAVVPEAVLGDVLDADMIKEAIDGALDLVATENVVDPMPALEAEIRTVEQERDRFVAAVAAGGSLDVLLGALKQREATLKGLEARRWELRSRRRQTPATDRVKVRRELLALSDDWRRVLVGEPEHARPILTTLLDGRVTFTPTGRPKHWEMHGTGTLSGLFSREIFPLGMASPSTPSWNQIADFLDTMRKLREATGFAA